MTAGFYTDTPPYVVADTYGLRGQMDFLANCEPNDSTDNAKAYGDLCKGDGGTRVVVVGSGASKAAGYPLWEELIDNLFNEATRCGIEPDRLSTIKGIPNKLVVAHQLRGLLGGRYEPFLIRQFTGKDDHFTDLHRTIVGLRTGHILTTNYDRLLEAAACDCEVPLQPVNVCNDGERTRFVPHCHAAGTQRRIVHLHGSISAPAEIILTREDYARFYTNTPAFKQCLQLLLSRGAIFIGFSLEDEYIQAMLSYWGDLYNGKGAKHYALLPQPSNPDRLMASIRLERKADGIVPIFYRHETDGDHAALTRLLAHFQGIHSKATVHSLLDELRSYPNTAFSDDPDHSAVVQQPLRDAIESARSPERSAGFQSDSDGAGIQGSGGEPVGAGTEDNAPSTRSDEPANALIDSAVGDEATTPEVVIQSLDRIEKNNPDLSDHLRYRIAVNRANAYYQLGDTAKAAENYSDAIKHKPDTERLDEFRMLIAMFTGQFETAREIAESVINLKPRNSKAHAIRLRALSDDVTFEREESTVPDELRHDSEVALALSDLARRTNHAEPEEEYARIAVKQSPKWRDALFVLASLLTERTLQDADIDVGSTYVPTNTALLFEARDLYTQIVDMEPEQFPSRAFAQAYFNRGSVNKLLGDLPQAKTDVAEAYRRDRDRFELATRYALELKQDENLTAAIDVLERIDNIELHAASSFLLADSLRLRARPGDIDRARAVLEPWVARLDEVEDRRHRCDYVRLYLLLGDLSLTIEEVIGKIPAGALLNIEEHILRAEAAMEANLLEEASENIDQAFELVDDETDWFTRRSLARATYRAGRKREAFDLLRGLVVPRFFNDDTDALLSAALEIGKLDFVLEFCDQLRQNDALHSRSIEFEVEALARVRNNQKALELLDGWLPHDKDNVQLRLRRAVLLVGRNSLELAKADLRKLPSSDDVSDLDTGLIIQQLWRACGSGREAIQYAYGLYRQFATEELAHRALVESALFANPDWANPLPDVVQGDCAVILHAVASGEPKPFVIESGKSPDPTRGEIWPDSTIATALTGKRRGDEVEIGGTLYTISDIQDKMLYRAVALNRQYEDTFPTQTWRQGFKMPEVVPENPKTIEDIMGEGPAAIFRRDEEHRTNLERRYQRGELGVCLLSQMYKKPVYDTMWYLAGHENLGIICAPPDENRFRAAVNRTTSATSLVIDGTVIPTLAMLRLLPKLKDLGVSLIVPESVLYEYRKKISEAQIGLKPLTYLASLDGRPVVTRYSQKRFDQAIENLKDIVRVIEEMCVITGGEATLKIPEQSREVIAGCLGTPFLDALAIAKDKNIPLWTDDGLARGLAENEHRISGVWTQPVLRAAGSEVVSDDFIAMGLFALNFLDCQLTLEQLGRGLIEQSEKADDPLVRLACKRLAPIANTEKGRVEVIMRLIFGIWNYCPQQGNAERLVALILDSIPYETSSRKIAKLLYGRAVSQYLASRIGLQGVEAFGRLRAFLRRWRSNETGTKPERKAREMRRRDEARSLRRTRVPGAARSMDP